MTAFTVITKDPPPLQPIHNTYSCVSTPGYYCTDVMNLEVQKHQQST